MLEQPDKFEKGTLRYTIDMLYSYGMYEKSSDWDKKHTIKMVGRNYFWKVKLLTYSIDDTRDSWYDQATGRITSNEFKTKKNNYKFDYGLPKKVKESMNVYITSNKNNKYVIETQKNTTYDSSSLATISKR